ncbi:MAG: hypothetical protein WC099_01240 [Candidatus Paceibacterota bacterium]
MLDYIHLSISILIILAIGFMFWIFIFVCRKVAERFNRMEESLKQIADSKRLSTLLTIEGKTNLEISEQDFAPKKEVVKNTMIRILTEKENVYGPSGSNTNPDTWAFCIIYNSGYAAFISSDTANKAKLALTRPLTNNDIPAAKRFISTLVRNL